MKTKKRRLTRTGNRVRVRLTFNLGGGGVRHEMLDGRDHLVVPCTMMTEGVHEGNNGKGYYPASETVKTTPSWDHMPITLDHPKRGSARRAKVLNRQKLGVVLHTRWVKAGGGKPGRLRAEAWLDYARTKKIEPRIISAVENGQKVEVSTGILLKRDKSKKGVWNSEKYDWIARNQTPDHLAILVDGVGACSIKDGAGLMQFNRGVLRPAGAKSLRRAVSAALKPLGLELTANELSMNATSRALQDALGKKFGEKGSAWYGYVVDVYKDFVVFCDRAGQMYSIGYTATDAGVTLKGEASEVRRDVTYKAVQGGESYTANAAGNLVLTNNTKGTGMLTTQRKRRMVRRLIVNSGGTYTAKDRKGLMDMPDTLFKKVYNSQLDTGDDDEVVVNSRKPKKKERREKVNNGGRRTRDEDRPRRGKGDDWRNIVPPEVIEVFNYGKRTIDRRRDQLVEMIMNTKGNVFSEKYLKKRTPEELEGLARLANSGNRVQREEDEGGEDGDIFVRGFEPDFSGAPGSFTNNRRGRDQERTEDDEPLEMPDLFPTKNSRRSRAADRDRDDEEDNDRTDNIRDRDRTDRSDSSRKKQRTSAA